MEALAPHALVILEVPVLDDNVRHEGDGLWHLMRPVRVKRGRVPPRRHKRAAGMQPASVDGLGFMHVTAPNECPPSEPLEVSIPGRTASSDIGRTMYETLHNLRG